MAEQITRRNLPHWYVPNAAVFVTFRIAGTIPRDSLDRLKRRKEQLLKQKAEGISTSEHRKTVHRQIFAHYDRFLDNCKSLHWLSNPQVAAKIRSNLWHHHESRYRLLSFSIMPNHVHVLFRPFENSLAVGKTTNEDRVGETVTQHSPLAKIMHSIKSFTAHEINRIMERTGQVWQHESYDHWIRDEEEMERIVGYIDANAPSARLAEKPHKFFWCSAHDRFLRDGQLTGWLGEEGQRET